MAVVLVNRWKQLLVVRLNSGEALCLAPRERSRRLHEAEIADNAAVAKMGSRGWLGVERRDDAR